MLDSMTSSLRICQEGHANALALNKDYTQIAVAGRSLLKVFSIDSDGFTEVCNMRGGKNQNLSYSSNDVAWSILDSNILATAATNGVVSVWDLSKFGRQKQLLVYNEHERTAHTVTFHSSEPYLLISGSQDGTIKCFDTRYEKSVFTYFSNSESVRDVKFSPHATNIFSAVSENGTVQLWDLRKSDKCILQFTAHSGPIYTCDWHPTKNWLATGSRDKQIKVWNMDGKASLEHTIHTIAVVGRVKWRPERTHHIASCALVVDYSIHIWDIRRPYIPFASFNDHTNVTTGIAWKGNDSHILLSTSKDSTIYKHAFKDAARPALKANPQGASLNHKDDILHAIKVKVNVTQPTPSLKSTSLLSKQKASLGVEHFHMAQSVMHKFLLKPSYTGYIGDQKHGQLKEYECFIGCAKEFILTGRKFIDICDHNAHVSKKFGKHSATTFWKFVKMLYGTSEFSNQKIEQRNSFTTQKNVTANRRIAQTTRPLEIDWNNRAKDTPIDDDEEEEEDSAKDGLDDGGQNPQFNSVILSENQILNDITFENFDMLRNGFLYMGPPDFTKALSLPETALHHDVQAARPQQDMKSEKRDTSPPPDKPSLLKCSTVHIIPMWEPHQFIADSLKLQSDVGDVQTALCVVIAMGDARKFLPIEETLLEEWFHSYIELLHRYQLWNEACQIINLSWIRSVRELNQKSTSVHTNCGDCGRPLNGAVGWYCAKCKSMQSSKCCVCGLVVRGLYAWCQGCSHGGHLEHLKEYFSSKSVCPKCGHLCEYN
ncbi:GATOR complex protein WDR24 isoform X1 [Episyrphus balteatus]|uniref:GATOR complex protein WDR24 isoform X1 n=2 Tax=Episyrphus balteatus TaxID=286459 RepID=UPI0024858CC8|nr:GATOR complex protein WDR24 isoform X1 [Episyrphus balteatus]